MENFTIKPDYHIGHILLNSLRRYPESICQIDGATGSEETFASVLCRSVKLAKYIRSCGLQPGDVLAIGGWNHLDLHIPFYSALFNGLPILGVDPNFKYTELKQLFEKTSPKISFCEEDFYETYVKVATDLGLDMVIITFGSANSVLFKLINDFEDTEPEENFQPVEFDVDSISPFLISTSGTVSDKLKVAAFKYQVVVDKILDTSFTKTIGINSKILHVSPVNWMTSFHLALYLPVVGQCNLQTSSTDNVDIIIDMINKYKPTSCLINPTLVSQLLQRRNEVNLKCFSAFCVTGSKLYSEKIKELRECLSEDAFLIDSYGQTETLGAVTIAIGATTPLGSCGKGLPKYSLKLIDPDTGKEITEPGVTGELCVKGAIISEYLNDPEETRKSVTSDGYYNTGDLLYRDENYFYFFVDRIKTVIKYRIFQVLPSTLEDLIRSYDGVRDVYVLGIEDPVDGEHPVACVIKQENNSVTAQEIKDLVAEKLSKNNQLRGGVLFLNEFPTTTTGKVSRRKLKEIVLNSERE